MVRFWSRGCRPGTLKTFQRGFDDNHSTLMFSEGAADIVFCSDEPVLELFNVLARLGQLRLKLYQPFGVPLECRLGGQQARPKTTWHSFVIIAGVLGMPILAPGTPAPHASSI